MRVTIPACYAGAVFRLAADVADAVLQQLVDHEDIERFVLDDHDAVVAVALQES
jgi:hypothetical protein